jgi:peptide chain release factor subunit 1
MLNRDDIAKIAKIKGNGNYFVSCYLNVDPVHNTKSDYLIHIKNMLKESIEGLEKDIRKKVKPDLDKIDSYIFANKRTFKKGIALFSSIKADFWKEFHFSVSLKNEIIIDRAPYIKPLLNLMDFYPRYVVMIIDKESARLFAVYLGEIQEYREIFTENVPGRHKKGGWFSLSERSFERHIDYHVNLHIKDVIKQLEKMLVSGDISRLVVGGSEETLARARSLFPKQIADMTIGTFQINLTARVNEVLSKVSRVIDTYENKEKSLHVEDLLTRTLKKENAVLGLDNVLGALQEGRIMKLLYLKDYKNSGYCCQGCGFLTSQYIEQCPYCKKNVIKVDYIIDLAAQKAIEQGAVVEVIHGNEKLEQSGNIGALLRY